MTTILGSFSSCILANLRSKRSLNAPRRTQSLDHRRKPKTAFELELPSAYTLPVELLEQIIELYIEECFSRLSDRTGPSYIQLASLTLASKQLRQITLRIYFRYLDLTGFLEDELLQDRLLEFLSSVDSQNKRLALPGGHSWVRSLRITSSYFSISPSNRIFPSLKGLKDLQVNLAHEILPTQYAFLRLIFAQIGHSPVLQNLTSVSLTCVPWISKNVLMTVSQASPNLVQLNISSTGCLQIDCCPTCYEDSMSRVFCSPVPELHPNVDNFSSMIGSALSPLKRLTHLSLGLFLSPSILLENHSEHTSVSRDWSFFDIHNCEACCSAYEDSTKTRELTATTIISKHLAVLELLSWDTCFEASGREERALPAKARFSIGRGNEGVGVTRLPQVA